MVELRFSDRHHFIVYMYLYHSSQTRSAPSKICIVSQVVSIATNLSICDKSVVYMSVE